MNIRSELRNGELIIEHVSRRSNEKLRDNKTRRRRDVQKLIQLLVIQFGLRMLCQQTKI